MAEQQKYYLRLKVITPRGMAVDQEVSEVVYPAHDGLCGVMSLHAPMLNKLGMGILRYKDLEKKEYQMYIEGGFARIGANEVRVLARQAIPAAEITKAQAEELALQAKTMSGTKAADIEARSAATQRAKYWLRLAETRNS
jgi:F-type H+-transporting ATPase subunit epsilon